MTWTEVREQRSDASHNSFRCVLLLTFTSLVYFYLYILFNLDERKTFRCPKFVGFQDQNWSIVSISVWLSFVSLETKRFCRNCNNIALQLFYFYFIPMKFIPIKVNILRYWNRENWLEHCESESIWVALFILFSSV